jgi:predicted DNA-binding transcriptional regulator YafY
LRALCGPITPDGHGGGIVEGTIPRSEIDWFAGQFLAAGIDVVVESPPELIAAMRAQVAAIAALYCRQGPATE